MGFLFSGGNRGIVVTVTAVAAAAAAAAAATAVAGAAAAAAAVASWRVNRYVVRLAHHFGDAMFSSFFFF